VDDRYLSTPTCRSRLAGEGGGSSIKMSVEKNAFAGKRAPTAVRGKLPKNVGATAVMADG